MTLCWLGLVNVHIDVKPSHTIPGSDLRFYKGGCPIHLKGAPDVERRSCRGVGCGKRADFFGLYIKMVSFYAFPVIFIDTVTFKKGTLIKRAGVRTPCIPTLDPPLDSNLFWQRATNADYLLTYVLIQMAQITFQKCWKEILLLANLYIRRQTLFRKLLYYLGL